MKVPVGGVGNRREVLGFCPVHQEIRQSLRLDRSSWLVLNVVGREDDRPLCHPSGGVLVVHNLRDWRRADNGDDVFTELVLGVLDGKVDVVDELLVVMIVLLGLGQHFADVVHWPLDQLVLLFLWALYHEHCTDDPGGGCDIQHHGFTRSQGRQHRRGGQHLLEVEEGLIRFSVLDELVRFLEQLV